MAYLASLRTVGREFLAIAAISLLGFVYLGGNWETRPPSFMIGRVSGFGLVEQKGYGQIGSVVRATVKISENQTVSISLSNGSLCRVGSPIEIEEAHTLFGSRFKAALRECSSPAIRPATKKDASIIRDF